MKEEMTKLIEQLPATLAKVNEFLIDEEIIMIDFMDGEKVHEIEQAGDEYDMLDEYGYSIDVVDINHLLRNSLYA